MRPKIVTAKKFFFDIILRTPIEIWASEFFHSHHVWPLNNYSKLTPRGHLGRVFGHLDGRKMAKNGPIWSIRNLAWLPMTVRAQRTFQSSNRSPNKNFGFFEWGGETTCVGALFFDTHCLVLCQECVCTAACLQRDAEKPEFLRGECMLQEW